MHGRSILSVPPVKSKFDSLIQRIPSRTCQLFSVLALSLLLLSCKREGGGGVFCIKPRGASVKRTITPEAFSSVRMQIPARAVIRYSPEFSIEVEGEENILDNIQYEIQDGELKVQFDRCVRKVENPPKMIFSAPFFYGYYLMAGGSLTIADTLKQPGSTLALEISGSGEIQGNVGVGALNGKISGSGSIRVSGTADAQYLTISGSGDVHDLGLNSNRAEVDISGSGNANVRVKDYLKVKISGSGNVNYYGSPALEMEVSGSGKVLKMD